MYIEDLKEACRRAMIGNESALKELGLDDATYDQPRPRSSESNSLQRNYHAMLNTAVAARELQLNFLERQKYDDTRTLDYMQAIANGRNVQLNHIMDSQDVAEIMLALIDEEKRHIQPEIGQESESDSDREQVVIKTSQTAKDPTRSQTFQQSTATDKTGTAKGKERPDVHHADASTAEEQPPDQVQPATSPSAHTANDSAAEEQPATSLCTMLMLVLLNTLQIKTS